MHEVVAIESALKEVMSTSLPPTILLRPHPTGNLILTGIGKRRNDGVVAGNIAKSRPFHTSEMTKATMTASVVYLRRNPKKKRHRKRRDVSSSDSEDDRKKGKRRRKVNKDTKKKSNTKVNDKQADPIQTFGKYGILKASDFHKKQRSFTVWMEEVKGILSFTGPKWELQEYFKEYAEDFNTATLPHIKYYDYDKWEMEEYQKNKLKTETSGSSMVKDEAVHMMGLKEKAAAKQKEEFAMVKSMMNKDKINEMKRKTQLQAEMAHAYKVGDQETYLRLKSRLEPER
jgi:hypothetical protein